MTQAWAGKSFHQVFYAWTEVNRGHAIVASSLPEHEVQMWNSRLGNLVRLQPVRGFELPGTALSYQEFPDGRSAVLRRTDAGYSAGRNNAHVLIGDAAVLDFPLALDLVNWPGWQTEMPLSTAMDPLDPRKVETEAGTQDWRREAERVEDAAASVLSELLKNPAAPLSVIGCPEADRLPLLWALREAGDRALRARERVWRWSFSTYEDRHADINFLPEIVFLPELPFGGTHRTVVDLGRQYAVSPAARQLVGQLFRKTTAQETVEVSWRDHVPVQQPTTRHRDDVVPTEPEQGVSKQTAPKPPRSLRELAEQFREASDVLQLVAALQTMSQLDAGYRDQLRGLLSIADVNRLTKLVEKRIPDALHRWFLTSVLGSDLQDLREKAAQKYLVDIVLNGDSRQLSRIAAHDAGKLGYKQVDRAGHDRWAEGGDPPGRDSFGPVGRVLRRMRQRRTVSVARVAAGLVVCLAMIGFGVWIGSPSEPTKAAPETTQETTPTTTTTPLSQPGVVTLPVPPATHVVYGFVQINDSYYPQSPCARADESGERWRCVQTGNPPSRNGVPSVLMAVVVPRNDLERLAQAAAQNGAVAKESDWGDTAKVPAG